MTKKSKQNASADIGLIFIAYNLKRIWNILREAKVAHCKSLQAFIIYLTTILSLLATLDNKKPKIVIAPRL
jgi:hypothetical protein